MAKNEEKPCHGNLQMICLQSTYESVSEAGEFGHNVIMYILTLLSTTEYDESCRIFFKHDEYKISP